MAMPIQTFSIVVGTKACNAKCPFCVSAMTGFGILPKAGPINEMRFKKAARLAQLGGTTTVLMTGKGEPTLYPDEVTEYLHLLEKWNFPLIELQTNAVHIGHLAAGRAAKAGKITRDILELWLSYGLNTIAISTVGVNDEHNRCVYTEDYPDLGKTVTYLHEIGFSVRLCVMMQRGCVDSPKALREVVEWCKERGVEQLTARPIRKPEVASNDGTSQFKYIEINSLSDDECATIYGWVEDEGTHLLTLMHGAHEAKIFDVYGQNLCISDCLTVEAASDAIRTLIFYSDGRVCFDWQFDGARLL